MSIDAAEGPTPAYLRRKSAQGRAAPRDKQ
jgi:hypothetical protein